MAEEVKHFPRWNPRYESLEDFYVIESYRRHNQERYKKLKGQLRNSCSGFIARKDVRKYIFDRDGHKCVKCGATEKLTIDHIISVTSIIYLDFPVHKMNVEENLQTLCKSCNSKKSNGNG